MKKTFLMMAMAITAILFSTNIYAGNPDEIIGIWMVPEKDGKVEVFKKEDGTYAGKIVWLLEPNGDDGTPIKDVENSDPELAKRPLMGMEVIWNFEYDAENDKWINGDVYNSRNGKTYSGFIKMQEDGTLFLRGHVKGVKFLGKTNIWERTEL